MAEYTLRLSSGFNDKEIVRWYKRRPHRIAAKHHKYAARMAHKTGLPYRLKLVREH